MTCISERQKTCVNGLEQIRGDLRITVTRRSAHPLIGTAIYLVDIHRRLRRVHNVLIILVVLDIVAGIVIGDKQMVGLPFAMIGRKVGVMFDFQ